ncbi:zinc ribbon domain-containing protein [Mariniblastus fucicola]|uniref:WD domain, G-beta repeat n=1 Tax=Mariniblastus fucicola TaxID=980251 RepID=A0A5B9P6I4_9BACT|nr:hypothetical protein [Mariniblastus fucicola]QEG21884.1 hypothetical protein MFFC18_17450 [Mariniblastus fucicola]
MAKPAKKIWCPKCHKRHRLPADAGGMTLRCRGCRFAFRVQDGLTEEPGSSAELMPEEALVAPARNVEPAHYASTEVLPFNESSGGAFPATPSNPDRRPENEPVGLGDDPVDLDDDYDDILNVLETPSTDPLAPPRAHAGKKNKASAKSLVQRDDGSLPDSATPGDDSNSNVTAVREPVTRQQLRAHRNARQFWMLVSLLIACVLAGVSWFSLNLFIAPKLGHWERKMLYAMGVPARWLPLQNDGGEILLPPNHVKLRGDHVELADRDDFFRDEFPTADRVGMPEPEDMAVNGGRDREPDRRGDRRGGLQPIGGARIAPGNNPNANKGAANRADRRNFGRRANRRNQPAVDAWQPPSISNSDIQMVATRGIDPKLTQMFAIDTNSDLNVALVRDHVFSISRGNRLSVFSIQSNSVLVSRKLDRDVAAVCAAAEDRISDRPAMWILYESGKLEKWELLAGQLNRLIETSVSPVFKEKHRNVAAGKRTIAYNHEGKIVIANVLEAASRIGSSTSVPVDGEVFALRFSKDSSQVLAVVEDSAVLIDAANGKIVSTTRLPDLSGKPPLQSSGVSVSADLSTVFLCQRGVIDAISIADRAVAGQYWGSLPIPIRGVSGNGNSLLGLTDGSPSQASLFTVSEMLQRSGSSRSGDSDRTEPMAKDGPEAGKSPTLLRDDDASNVAAKVPFEIDRSPAFSAPIKSIQTLPRNRIAVLTSGRETNSILIATRNDGWKTTALKLDPGFKIQGVAVAEDLSRFAIHSDNVVQSWKILDLDAGTTEFVSESPVNDSKITKLMLTGDGERVVSGDASGKVYASSFETGKQTGSLLGFRSGIVEITSRGNEGFVAMDRSGIATGSGNTNRDRITSFGTSIRGASALSENGGRIAYGYSGKIRVADVSSQKVRSEFSSQVRPESIKFSNSQKYLLLQGRDAVAIWDWRKKELVRTYRFGSRSVPVTVDLGIGGDDQTVAVVTGRELNQISIFEMPQPNE